MRFYILMLFWILFAEAVIRLGCVAILDYPRHMKKSLGADVAACIVSIFLATWASILLWGTYLENID